MPRTAKPKAATQIIVLTDLEGDDTTYTPAGLDILRFDVPALVAGGDTIAIDNAILEASNIADLGARVTVLVELAKGRGALAA